MCCLQIVKFANNGCRYLRPNNKIMGITSQRFESKDCNEPESYKCSTESIAVSPCRSYIKKRDKPTDTSPQYSFLMKSMWERAKCCVTCVQALAPLRHDVEYLKPSSGERRYQRTWPQCAERRLVPKKCKLEVLNLPEMKLRKRGERNPDAEMNLTFHDCMKVEKYEKPCKPNMCKPKGRCVFSEPSCCLKRCTQYPSYSECCAKDPNPKRPNECNCLYPNGLCEVNEYARRMGYIKPDEQ